MAIVSTFYDGSVGEQAWAKASAYLGKPPCVASPTAWKVTAVVGPDRTVRVAAGAGYGYGVYDVSDATVDVQLASIASGTRWDAVVARRDWTPTPGGGTTFVSVAGTSTQALPAGLLTNDGVSSDQVLALVQLTAGQSTPTAVIDLRGVPTNTLDYPSTLALPAAAPTGSLAIVAGHRYVKGASVWAPQSDGLSLSAGPGAVITFGSGGGTLGVTGGITPPAVAFPRVLRISFSALASSTVTGQLLEFALRKNGAVVRMARVLTVNTTVSGSYTEVVPAGVSDTYQLVAIATNAATIPNDSRFVYMYATLSSS